jgi:hypothetical protein
MLRIAHVFPDVSENIDGAVQQLATTGSILASLVSWRSVAGT